MKNAGTVLITGLIVIVGFFLVGPMLFSYLSALINNTLAQSQANTNSNRFNQNWNSLLNRGGNSLLSSLLGNPNGIPSAGITAKSGAGAPPISLGSGGASGATGSRAIAAPSVYDPFAAGIYIDPNSPGFAGFQPANNPSTENWQTIADNLNSDPGLAPVVDYGVTDQSTSAGLSNLFSGIDFGGNSAPVYAGDTSGGDYYDTSSYDNSVG